MLFENKKNFHGLSEPVRLKIIDALSTSKEPMQTSLIASLAGIKPSTTSHHLVKLTEDGLVLSMRNGVFVSYGLNHPVFADLAKKFQKISETYSKGV